MEIAKLTEKKLVAYETRFAQGTGRVVQVYKTKRNSTKVVLHDKARNVSVTVYPSEISAIPRAPAAAG
jgi:predicted ArsR family transcriptional regulator